MSVNYQLNPFTGRFDTLTSLEGFRDERTFYVSKRDVASNANSGTIPNAPVATLEKGVELANAYILANPTQRVKIDIGPGVYEENNLPLRLARNVVIQGSTQRATTIKPAAGEELNNILAVDSGCLIYNLAFAGHQASGTSDTDSTVGTRSWAITFNEAANAGLGPIINASPYIKDCLSITAEDDAGTAGSTSTGDTGGGVEVDGSKCHPNSPIRSMVVYGFTQQNLGGPGCIVKNDGYAELVSFFGLFGTWHVRCENGGQVTMSGGGCSEFGTYGLAADGYSPAAIFTGDLRVGALEDDTTVDVINLTASTIGNTSRPQAGMVMLLDGSVYIVQSSAPIDAGGNVVPEGDPTEAGYRVTFYNNTGIGLTGDVLLGAAVDFRLRSQISAGTHSANYVGAGTNYNALPWNGGVPNRANEILETNFGRVFGAVVNDVGDFTIADGVFKVDGTTGAVTINTDNFSVSGLNCIGPFSRNGGISTVGVQICEASDDVNLLASTGIPEDDTVPTQSAVKTYIDNTILRDISWKDSVVVRAQGNLDLSAPGATIDGISMSANDRFLVTEQTAPAENGIYIFATDATPATRSVDGSTFDAFEGAVVVVQEGTDAGTSWQQTAVNGTIDVNDLTFIRFGTPAGSDTEIQFNSSGAFGSSADLTWDDTGKILDVTGDVTISGTVDGVDVSNFWTGFNKLDATTAPTANDDAANTSTNGTFSVGSV